MEVAIIGAGISGLTAGWRLRRAGHRVRLFERNYKPGGRMNSRRKAGLVVDHGDRFILRDSPVLRELIVNSGLESEVQPILAPIYNLDLDGHFVETPEAATDPNRITFADGMLQLPEVMRRQLGGYYSIRVTSVEYNTETRRFVLQTDPPLRAQESQADAVLFAVPSVEALAVGEPILPLLNSDFVEAMRRVRYNSCFTLMAALSKVDLPVPFYGLIPAPAPHRTISWVAFEDRKCAGRGVNGWSVMLAHSTAEAAPRYLKMREEAALEAMFREARTLIPQVPDAWRWARAKRWLIAHIESPEMVVDGQTVMAAPDHLLVEFCGDFRAGDGCEAAAASGKQAAHVLIERAKALGRE